MIPSIVTAPVARKSRMPVGIVRIVTLEATWSVVQLKMPFVPVPSPKGTPLKVFISVSSTPDCVKVQGPSEPSLSG
jgi:hypothetical protein